MKNCKNKRMYIRYSVILKHFQGLTNKDIAKLEMAGLSGLKQNLDNLSDLNIISDTYGS